MATLIKEHEGLIFDEEFNENSLIWSLTPSNKDCLRFENDGLHILHNDEYITYTMKEMEEEYCLMTQIDHVPVSEEDIGGLIVLSDTDNYAECQTYLATSPSTIGNNGANVNPSIDLGDIYTAYSYYGGESEEPDSPSSIEDEGPTTVNPTTGFVDKVYQYLKMIKYNNAIGHTYQFFASHNGTEWIEVGNIDYNRNNSIGFFLYSASDYKTLTKGKFVVNSFYIYENRYITINGINILQDFEIYEYDNLNNFKTSILRSDTETGRFFISRYGNSVKINTNNLVLPLKSTRTKSTRIRIYTKGHYDDTISQFDLTNFTFGGDIFTINYDIQLRIDNEIVDSGKPYNLGTLFTRDFKRNVVIYNNEDIDFKNIQISIKAFSEYYSGEEVVKLAMYNEEVKSSAIYIPNPEYENDDNPEIPEYILQYYTYTDKLLIPVLPAHSGIELVMKLSDTPKQEFYSAANTYRFKMIIE